MAAPVEEVAAAIKSGGLANIKAVRIKQILREVERREGEVSLEHLLDLPNEDIEDYLISLPGVGPKSAACVLIFSTLARQAFPVDTHVHRVVRRLGWVEPKTSAESAHLVLTPVIPEGIRYELHRRFIAHGRTTCKAPIPLCSECVLFDLCEAGPRLMADGAAV